MNEFKVEGHEPSLMPPGEWDLVWSDEFDGTELDRSKWDYRLSMMGKFHPAWVDRGVHLDGKSNAVFELMMEDGRPVSAQLQTGYNFMDQPLEKTIFGADHLQWTIGKLHESLFLHKYGYYECRCRLHQNTDAWWSAFWIQSPVIGSSLDPGEAGVEIDVMECFQPGRIHHHNVICGGYGLDCRVNKVGGFDGLDQTAFHRFGVLWEPTGYTFYVDGVEDGHIDKDVSHRPEFIMISTEVKGYRLEDHAPVPAAFEAVGKDNFIVDYIRVFDPKA